MSRDSSGPESRRFGNDRSCRRPRADGMIGVRSLRQSERRRTMRAARSANHNRKAPRPDRATRLMEVQNEFNILCNSGKIKK